MKRITSILSVALVLFFIGTNLCSCVFAGKFIRPNRQYTTKVINIGSFNAVNLVGNCDIIFTPSTGNQSLELYASDNVINYIEVFVKDNTLVCKIKKGINILRNKDKMELRISAPMISKAEVTGSGSMYFTADTEIHGSLDLGVTGSGDIQMEGLTCKNLETEVTGSGNISVNNLKADDVNANVTGSGDITLAGNIFSANYQVTGSGDIHADNLMAKEVNAEVTGSGDISCYAIETLKANRSGSGDIHYKGNPQISTNKNNWLHHIQ
ncbi:head GIN domain-containing protein [Phocaeicola oris]|uniref:head GIN domain-containing protein n=1 Tax=Phocaeicola oris TaxID=2896850 RepID=UPI00234F52F3|nr:head GIN domain-containing protein [Phocaeicola oris]MCE2617474.1 DUF2807 domain-containing protein [Phocaeicola oris]